MMRHYHVTHSDMYKCSCGKEFKAFDKLWGHIAFIECKTYRHTLELLRRARLIFLMKGDLTPESINHLLDDIDEHCPQLVEDEPDKDERYADDS